MFENVPVASALLGGMMIGLAATLLLLFNGRIAGISGIFNGCLDGVSDRRWRWLFLFGLLGGAALYYYLFNGKQHYAAEGVYPALMIVGGFLVGFGTRLGRGCTSGHGVCGLGRLSPRSLVATLLFMFSGMVAVYFVRLLIGLG